MEKYIGLDIGGTKCAAVLGSLGESVTVEKKTVFPTEGKTPEEVLSLFSDFITKAMATEKIAGIGVACGGPLDSARGIVQKPPSLPLWDNIHVVEYFENKFGIPTYLRNDADACAVAEWKYGAGRGTDNMIFLTFGTGFGAGLILGGRLYTGASDGAGEIGHVRLTRTGPVGYNKAGSSEGYCSGSGMRRLALSELEREKSRGRTPAFIEKIGGEENISAKLLAEYARLGDPFAKRIYKKSGEMLGRTLSILIDLLNPEKIVIGGIFMRSGELLLPHAKRVIEKEALPHLAAKCEILPAALGELIGDASALAIAKGNM